MKDIVNKASEELGKELYEAQQKLAKHGYGCFEEWYTALGFKQRNVYHYINRYSFLQNLQNQKEIETFQELSPSLQNEVSKPSAKEEVNQAVFDGDIKTHKEYKEMERMVNEAEQAKRQAEAQAEQAKRSEEIALKRLEEVESREPERIEVVPDDYDYIKGNYESAISLQKRYKEQMEEMRRELEESNSKGNHEIDSLKKKESALKSKIKTMEKLNDVKTNLEVIISELSTKTHSIDVNEVINEHEFLVDFDLTIDEVINLCNALKNKLKDKNIIEGAVIND